MAAVERRDHGAPANDVDLVHTIKPYPWDATPAIYVILELNSHVPRLGINPAALALDDDELLTWIQGEPALLEVFMVACEGNPQMRKRVEAIQASLTPSDPPGDNNGPPRDPSRN